MASSLSYVANLKKPYIGSTEGLPLTQLFQHIPILDSFYTAFEKDFQIGRYISWAKRAWPTVPLAVVAIYLLMITITPRIMNDRKPVELKTPLALWNLCLSLFSFCGMVRTVPRLLHSIATKPFRDTICTPFEATYNEGPVGFWVMLFTFSKVPELIDTFFIIMRKRVSRSVRYRHVHFCII